MYKRGPIVERRDETSLNTLSRDGGAMTIELNRGNGTLCYRTAGRIDLTSASSVRFWTRLWGVTLIQLRIAVRKAGTSPVDIAKELGLGSHAVFDLNAQETVRMHFCYEVTQPEFAGAA